MEKWQNRKTTRLPGYDYSTEGAYFLTLCTENRQCLLSRIVGIGVLDGPCTYNPSLVGTGVLDGPRTHNPPLVGTGVLDGPKIQLLPFGEIADKYIKQLNDFYDHITVDSYVIMPNHIHILLSVKDRGPSGRPVTSGPSGRPVPTKKSRSGMPERDFFILCKSPLRLQIRYAAAASASLPW